MLIAQTSTIPWIHATLPFWPLLGAVIVGLMLMTGRFRQHADKAVIGCAAVAAALAIHLMFMINATPTVAADVGDDHAAAVEHGAEGESRGSQTHDEGHAPLAPKKVREFTVTRWISLGNGQWINLNFFLDPLTGVMLVTVTGVALMVIIYSVGYMRDHHGHPERGYERFFAFLGLFVFSMCMLVLAGNFVLLYLGWELVGLCSYLLIGFYYKKPAAAAAAKKAFIVNRIGDFGFALGIFTLYMFISPHAQPGENPLDYVVVFKYAHVLGEATLFGFSAATVIALLLFCGAVGKSAQFPLYVWLPDAMEGPSPVSALIHAATMVTAGVYMVARCGPIFVQSQLAMDVVTVVGAFTALFAATMAMAQFDMKRILAYSTISQLAYMFVGLGCGAPDSAVFHLFTHAFFKALLFLCAGSVMHAMGGVIDLRKFSGLRSVLPKTCVLMKIGCFALAGFPLLAGFWSKDEIVHAAFGRSTILGVMMLFTAFLTAYYTFRMFYLAFNGELRTPPEAGEQIHEAPAVMTRPLTVLAIGALVAGYFGVWFESSLTDSLFGFLRPAGVFHDYLAGSTIVRTAGHGGGAWLMYVSGIIALAGIGLAKLRYGEAPREDPDAAALGAVWNLWHAKYYVDEFNDRAFVQPLRRMGHLCFGTDNNLVDGLVWFVSAVPRGLGATLRLLQTGSVQGYGLGMAVGVVFLLLWWLVTTVSEVNLFPAPPP